jgi:hypothetical protein
MRRYAGSRALLARSARNESGRLEGAPTPPSFARRLGPPTFDRENVMSGPAVHQSRPAPFEPIHVRRSQASSALGVPTSLLRLTARILIVDLVSHDSQLSYRDLQPVGQLDEAAVSRIPGSPLEPGDMRRMQSRALAELPLIQATHLPRPFDGLPERPQSGRAWSQRSLGRHGLENEVCS